jgi:hypothetical protein
VFFRKLDGPFCRTCGIAAVRSLSAQTLVEGWWGLFSSVITPVTLVINFFTYLRIRALPDPGPHRPGPGLALGKPLLRRWHALGILIPVVVVGLIATAGAVSPNAFQQRQPDDIPVGLCVVNSGSESQASIAETPCGPGALQVVLKLPDTQSGAGCPQEASQYYVHEELGNDGSFVLCLAPYGS